MKRILLILSIIIVPVLSGQMLLKDKYVNAQTVVNSYRFVTGSFSLTDSLVAYYPFNGNANDESGNGYNSTANTATLTTDRFANSNSAYSFNNQTITLPLSLGNRIKLYDFTVSVWIENTSTKTLQVIFTLTDDNSFGDNNSVFEFNLGRSTGTDIEWYVGNDAATNIIGSISVSSGWHHLVGIREGFNISFYLDNSLVGTATTTDDVSTFTPTKMLIGNNVGRYFVGKIDDIRLYSRVLNESEINILYNE